MKFSFKKIITGILFLAFACVVYSADAKDLIIVEKNSIVRVENSNLFYVMKNPEYLVVEWDKSQQKIAEELSISFIIIAKNIQKEQAYYIFELREEQKIPHEWFAKILYRNGLDFILAMEPEEAEGWISKGYHAIRIMHQEYLWKPAPAYIPFTCTYNALIADLLSRTNQAQWLDWDEKITGVDPVDIGGTEYNIRTRYSTTLFNGSILGKGYDFALQQAQEYHYGSNIEEDPYQYSSSTWKNLILTIPGQTAPGDMVLITAHYDTTSGSSMTNAPGADDNGSGSVALYESMRLLRQYRFQRTIKIIYFTGEEQGLVGSQRYVSDHPTSSILGVVNLDMFGWDGNDDRCFEIHTGTMASSQDVGHCFEDSISAYSINLTHDFIITNPMTGSDQVSFWNVGVGAIEILENGQNNNFPGGCVGTDWNPYYHTINDTTTNLNVPYVYDISRAGLATIAAMAIPIEACFTTAPVLAATPDILKVDLNWTSVTGASTYRVFRSTQGCEGQWLEQTETAGTTYTDTNVTGSIPYYYYVEAVASDGFCVSAMSNCANVTPASCISCAEYQNGSAAITGISGGDGDTYLDNCETATTHVAIKNKGSAVALHTMVTVSSPDPFITITTPMPLDVGDIPYNESVETAFTFGIGKGTNKAACMQTGSFEISVQSEGQNPADQDSFNFEYEFDYVTGDKTWAFESATGLEGWTVSTGTWALSSARVNPGGSTASVHSSQYADNQCDVITSPEIEANATSQLTLPNWYSIEPAPVGIYYDKANVHIINTVTSQRTIIAPMSGKQYQTGTFFDFGGACNMLSEPGWAGDTSGNVWSNSVFDLSLFATQKIKIEIHYVTDSGVNREGVYIDDLTATGIKYLGCDTFPDACTPVPELRPYNGMKPVVNDATSPKANGIIDMDETVTLVSTLENIGAAMATVVTGQLSTSAPIVIDQANASFPNIAPGSHQVCTNCYSVTAPSANRPATHWDFIVTDTISATNYGPVPYGYTYHVGESFSDVSILTEYYIEALLHSSITSGCTPGTFCPANNVLRQQTAKFICLAMEKETSGSCTLSSCIGIFVDVPASNPFCSYIEALYADGIVSGCQTTPLQYCPNSSTQRQAMAKLVCAGMNSAQPASCITSSCNGIFTDVPSSNMFCPYIEALYNVGVIAGCQASPLMYCPNNNVQRQAMAKFLVLGFGLNL